MSTRVAACHVSSIFLSASKTTQKAISLIHKATINNAHLVVFPGTYIPAFPLWSALRAPTENHALFERMLAELIHADGPEIDAIRSAAKEARVLRSVLNHHRKLMPTFFKKLTWAPGDGHGLRVSHTAHGNIGNLICGENTNPLARHSLIAQAEQIHISTWPAIWPTRLPSESFGGERNSDNVAANRTRTAAHCFEAKCFGVLCAGVLGPDAVEMNALVGSSRGASMFLDPPGATHPAFVVDENGENIETEFLQSEEGILYADFVSERCVEGKQYHDVVGGYQRLDVFDLR
ncbi:hypothetical protein BDW74DRAFT_189052 [Aspergillus multicolor]|uniref:carbon-nitrogen hydrolase family protein n=1 Tax=Aspergillus multicolor TaxID=41759 RepID=UPI003CCD9381